VTKSTSATSKSGSAKTIGAKNPASKTAKIAPPAVESVAKSTAKARSSSHPAQAKATHTEAEVKSAPTPSGRSSIKSSTVTDNMPSSATKVDSKLANAWKTKAGRDLTEAELQAMPDSEYMNDKQLDFFRRILEVQKEDLLSNAGETTEHLREDTSIVPDPADRATIEEEHALELRTRDRERKLLKKISQALVRIDAGEYGFCDETGEPIGLGRLLARPTATLSLEAQQRRELKQKMFGD